MKNFLTMAIAVLLGLFAQNARAETLTGEGRWTSNSGAAMTGTWSANLVQTDDALTGTFSIEGSPLMSGGSVTGSITEDEVVLGVMVSGSTEARFSAKIEGTNINGEWAVPAIADTGTWSGTLE